jgi:hypothetical protein
MTYLFASVPNNSTTLGTPLHAACSDPDGQRGEAKIALLFEAANEVGFALVEHLTRTRTKEAIPAAAGVLPRGGYTPLHRLAMNPNATQRSFEMVCNAWPGAFFAETCVGNGKETPLDTACSYSYRASQPSRIATMLQYARDTQQDIEALVMHRNTEHVYTTCLRSALDPIAIDASMEHVIVVIVEHLLRACPAVSYTTNYSGTNCLHERAMVFCRGDADRNESILSLLTCVVSYTSKAYLVTALSTEAEESLGGVVNVLTARLQCWRYP